jgi:Fe-S-cluster-containing dehydrogenase component
VDKCTFCLHRVEAGKLPACVEVCPTSCLHFGDLSNQDSDVSRLLRSRQGKVLHPETGCRPNVYFLA